MKLSTRTTALLAVLMLTLFQTCTCPVFSAACKTTDECVDQYNKFYICRADNKCGHGPLLPLNAEYIIGFVLIVMISALANAGGLGGGAVIVPVYMFLFHYLTPEAIPLSKATILAGAIMNVALIINRRHPKNKDKLVIDYGVAGSCVPLLLAGTMIGIMFTAMFPPLLTLSLLSAYLVFSGYKMFLKARSESAKEKAANAQEALRIESADPVYKNESDELKRGLLDRRDSDGFDLNGNTHDEIESDEKVSELISGRPKNPKAKKNRQENGVHDDQAQNKIPNGVTDHQTPEQTCGPDLPPANYIEDKALSTPKITFCEAFKHCYIDVLTSVAAYFTILVVAILRGGHGMDSVIGIEFCSTPGWLLFAFAQLTCLVCSLSCYYRHRSELLSEDGKGPQERQRKKTQMVWLLILSYASGVGAGTLGIGGGMIINPVLLSMGFLTEVAAAVAGFSVLFTSSSTTSQFAIAGAIDIKQAFIFQIFSAAGSLVGNCLILRAVDKYKRPSILIWILCGVLGASMCVLPTMGIYQAVVSTKPIFEFGSPCVQVIIIE